MMSSIFFILFFAIFLITFLLTSYLYNSRKILQILDHPNARSLHQQPIPRSGGFAVLCGVLLGGISIGIGSPNARPIIELGFIGLVPLVIISLLDDLRGVAVSWRMLIHLWAAVSLLIAGFAPEQFDLPGSIMPLTIWVSMPLTLLFIIWMINLYNFMDGMDGFASGMAIIGFGTLACLGRSDTAFMVFCLSVAAASAGFWVHNFPPAKIFLGDVGSTTLGFLVAACSLWGAKLELFPLWVALLVFSPFIVDATVTLLRRLLQGKKVWEPHRSHCYQRLVLLGWGHRRTVLTEYSLMLVCAIAAMLAVQLSPIGQIGLVIFWVLLYGFLIWGVGWLERQRTE